MSGHPGVVHNRVHEPFVAVPHRWLAEGHAARMGASAAVVWLALLYHAGQDGRAWPSHATLAAETGLGERTVREALARLRELGYLSVIEERPGRTTIYAVELPPTPAKSAGDTLGQAESAGDPGKICRGTPAKSADEQESIEQESRTTTTSTTKNEKTPNPAAGTSEGGEAIDPEEIQAEIHRRRTRIMELDLRRAGLKAAQRIAEAVLEYGTREVWAAFVELTRAASGMREAAWHRWLRLEIEPHLQRLGPRAFALAVTEAVTIASRPGIRSPAAVIAKRLAETPSPNGAANGAGGNGRVTDTLDLDAILAPFREELEQEEVRGHGEQA